MAFVTVELKIPQLMQSVPVQLYFPTDLPDAVGNEVKGVITLLHGMSNTPSDWLMMSAACRYAADNGYVLVVPGAGNSFFIDMAYGPPWHTILTKYLPDQLQRIFKLPTERKKNFVAGISMGGYGAMHLGLSHPERYAAIGSFSGAMDLGTIGASVDLIPDMRSIFAPVLGDDLTLSEDHQLLVMAKKVAALPKEQQPRIFATCGAQDVDTSIRTQNRNFFEASKDLALSYTYAEWDGVHEWNFWDRSFAEFIGFIQNSDYGQRKLHDWGSIRKNFT